jgi:glutamyl-tRNA(Gln) amidotransferase subunit E
MLKAVFGVINMKCGIEIHQRLAVGHKLFCNCPCDLSEQKPTQTIKRRMRVTMGELGGIDPAAAYEIIRGREYKYLVFPETCFVESDDEPPHSVNNDALEVALKVALMCNCNIPDEIHIMRKTVLDGSNTSGFQRTMLVGIGTENSYIETSEGKVRIKDINLEEESAGIVEETDGLVTYRLDRLGIPLIEIGTKADIKSPAQAKEVALKLGWLLRSTGKVMRGIGTIRQDINISVEGGARVEIKGVQELDLIEDIAKNEIARQQKLLDIKKFLGGSLSVLGPYDVTENFAGTKCKLIGSTIKSGGVVLAVVAKGLVGLLKTELCPGKTLGRELADYAKAHGCKGLIHTDEDLEKYSLVEDFEKLYEKYNLNKLYDAIIIIAERRDVAERAIKAVASRIKLLSERVPEETRVANLDGTTRYTRPLPGGERMYPETDLPPIVIDKDYLHALARKLPESWEKKLARFKKILSSELAEQILKSEYLELFEKLSKSYDPKLVASTLVNDIKALRREGVPVKQIPEERLEELFALHAQKRFGKEIIPIILRRLAESPASSVEEILKSENMEKISEAELEKIIKEVFEKYPYLYKEKRFSAIMGEVMSRVRGRASGTEVAEKIKKMLNAQ